MPQTTSKKKVRKKAAVKAPAPKVEPQPKIEEIIDTTDLDGKFILIRVGNDKYPAEGERGDEMIEKVYGEITELLDGNGVKNCMVYVTTHLVDIKVVS
tara:strand:+ start:1634 stop:1927 length:294 start_codon:yes stop_codon:yes gene_type:complete